MHKYDKLRTAVGTVTTQKNVFLVGIKVDLLFTGVHS